MDMQLKKVDWGGNSFEIGKYPVTQAQWEEVMGINPSYFKECPKCPVEQVSWDDVQVFLKKLNQMTGQNYRLPTEAEWEYAARGGEEGAKDDFLYSGSNDIDAVAWYFGNSKDRTHEVGQKQPNQLGLYDMSGNVWEWCEDVWHGDYKDAPANGLVWIKDGDENCSRRVLRGGCWYNDDLNCRPSVRNWNGKSFRFINSGFRLARGGSWSNNDGSCRPSFRVGINTDDRDFNTGFRLAH